MKGNWIYIFVCIFVLSVAFADYFNLSPFNTKEKWLAPDNLMDSQIFQAIIVSEPEQREWNSRLTVRALRPDIVEKILLTTDRYADFSYGDILEISGKLERPENFVGDTGREFDYIGYLGAKGIRYVIKNPKIYRVGYDPPSKISAALIKIKQKFTGTLEAMLPEPQSSLAAGILIDGKRSITGDLQEQFRKVGIVHIVVLSGYNVTIVAETITKVFSLLFPRLLSIGFASAGIILFAIMTGGTATVVRASIMALLALLAQANFRRYDAVRALFLTGFLMILQNPRILLHDPSFQLSFMATFSVVFLVPRFEKFFRFLPEKFGMREIITSTTVTQFFLLPMLMVMTGKISLVALPVNFLVLPIIPISMLGSFITACLGFIHSLIALPAAFITNVLLSYTLALVKWFAAFPFAEIEIAYVPWIFVLFLYAAFFLVVFLNNKQRAN